MSPIEQAEDERDPAQWSRPMTPAPGSGIAIPRKFTARYLRHFRFAAQTIFDVGVCRGTPALYKLFAGRRLVLIDPLAEAQENVRQRSPDLAFDFLAVGLGAAEGTVELNIARNPAKSGIPARTALTAEEITERRRVRLTTLDRIVAQQAYPEPFGLKLDTEGYELEILRGAERALQKTEFIITEASIKKRFVGGYRFSELIGFLAARGFELIDILNLHGGTPRYYDCVFLRHDHPMFEGRPAES
jgi:FkbM family methyltransferase